MACSFSVIYIGEWNIGPSWVKQNNFTLSFSYSHIHDFGKKNSVLIL